MNTKEIGENAGLIWNLLNEKGALTLAQIKKELKEQASGEDICLAMGWLFREDKLETIDKDKKTLISLK
ncbi:MAG: winged helix-turn-helix domain-containing protein [Paludibacteraceae bacterium]|nr:winged helix-turn-helix domain-containing protein [Paludibacteraceae bacterium]